MQGPSRRQHWGGCKPDITGRSGNGPAEGRQLNGRYNYTSDEQCVSLSRTAGRLEVSNEGPFGAQGRMVLNGDSFIKSLRQGWDIGREGFQPKTVACGLAPSR